MKVTIPVSVIYNGAIIYLLLCNCNTIKNVCVTKFENVDFDKQK